MNIQNVLLPALATLIAGVLIPAPAAAQEERDLPGQVVEAAMSKTTLGAPLTFGVEGLTEKNLEKVTQSLTSLTEKVFVCSGCEHMQATAGTCIPCDVKLEAKEEPILSEVLPSLKKANIQLIPFAMRTLSYSELEGALTKNSIEIDAAKFPLAGESRLVLHGGTSENIEAIEKALKATGFFDSAKANYDAESTEIHVVVHATATPPMHDKVVAVIEALDSEATLVDVIWGPQPVPAKTGLPAGFLITAPAAQNLPGQVKDAAMSKTTLGAPLTFSVEGLTEKNLEKVTQSLTSLTEKVFVCSGCEHMQATAGTCIPCDVKLEAKEEPILSEVLPSLKKANIQLIPFAMRTLSYSELEGALTKNSIEIDAAKFPLAGESRLVLHGGTSENIEAIEKALKATGFFDSAKANYDAESTEIHVVVHANATPPMHDKVVAVIEALDSEATLVDVIWGPQPVPAKT